MTISIPRWTLVCLALCSASLPAGARAYEATAIQETGSPDNRVDLVILGDGYTRGELQKFSRDADALVERFFAEEPFREYRNYFNVYRIDVASNQSGADVPPGLLVDTAFGATFWCRGIERLLCVDEWRVSAVLDNAVLPSQRDIVLVLVNSPEYGGSGGAIAVASDSSLSVELARHEIGHSFGFLADEYDTSPPACDPVEPAEANVTAETNRSAIKWNSGGSPPGGWIEVSTAVPTATTAPGVPGLYQGAKYCGTDLYRPTQNSKMRTLGYPYDKVNAEQLVLRIYGTVSPLDSFSPAASDVSVSPGSGTQFEVTVPSPATHRLSVRWELDNAVVGSGPTFRPPGTLSGPHDLVAVVSDSTGMVRHDPQGLLTERRSWKVTGTKVPSPSSPPVLRVVP